MRHLVKADRLWLKEPGVLGFHTEHDETGRRPLSAMTNVLEYYAPLAPGALDPYYGGGLHADAVRDQFTIAIYFDNEDFVLLFTSHYEHRLPDDVRQALLDEAVKRDLSTPDTRKYLATDDGTYAAKTWALVNNWGSVAIIGLFVLLIIVCTIIYR